LDSDIPDPTFADIHARLQSEVHNGDVDPGNIAVLSITSVDTREEFRVAATNFVEDYKDVLSKVEADAFRDLILDIALKNQ
jgi:hypothetical protein